MKGRCNLETKVQYISHCQNTSDKQYLDEWVYARFKLTVASSKFATRKSDLPPVKNVGSKKLLPGNSVMTAIS